MQAEVNLRSLHEEPLQDGGSLSTFNSTKPKVPPRPWKRTQQKLTDPELLPVEESLSPVEQLQCSRPVIYSRTSSHSSGFEEGPSSLVETSDAFTWKDILPRVYDCPKWTGGSLDDRTVPANHEVRETEPDCTPITIPKSQSFHEDAAVRSPEVYLSAEDVYGEYFASRQSTRLLASCEEPQEVAASVSHASAIISAASDTRTNFTKIPSDVCCSTKQTTDQIRNVRTGQGPNNFKLQTPPSILGHVTDREAICEHSEFAPQRKREDKANVDPSDGSNNRNLRERDKLTGVSHLSSKGASDDSSCKSTSKKFEGTCLATENDDREERSQFNDETFYKKVVPQAIKNRQSAVLMDTRSPSTIEETLDTVTLTKRTNSFSSSASSKSDKDLTDPGGSDKDLTKSGSMLREKTVARVKDKPTVSRALGSRSRSLQVTRSQSFQSQRRSSNSATNETLAPRSSQMDPETRGASGRRKNIAIVAGDEDFGRFHSKPHGIETRMVLPYTECQRSPGLEEQMGSISAIRKFWLDKCIQPPKSTNFPGISRRREPEELRFDEGQSSASKIHQSVTRSTLTRRHSDKWDRLASEMTGMFSSNRSVHEIANRDTETENPVIKPREQHPGGVPSSVQDNLETRSLCNLSLDTEVDGRTSHGNELSSTARTSGKPKRIDAELSESHSVSNISGITSQVSHERFAGIQPLHETIPENRYRPVNSQHDVKSDLELAKKFEAFNVRLAAMASAAASKHSPRSTCSDTGNCFDSFQPGKWMSSEKIISEEASYDETKAASAYEEEHDAKCKPGKLPVLREATRAINQKTSLGTCMPSDIWRRQNEADDKITTMYSSSFENRNQSADSNAEGFDKGSLRDTQLWPNKSDVSWKTEQGRRLSSSITDLHRASRGDEFASRTPETPRGSYSRLGLSGRHITGSERALFRSQSTTDSCQFVPKPRKTLQEHGEELQQQFSRWHRQLVSENSRPFFGHKDNEENDAKQPNGAFLSKSIDNWSSLDSIPQSERLQYISNERIAAGTGARPILRRSMSDREVHDQETSSDPTTRLWIRSDEILQKDRKKPTSVSSLDKILATRPLMRSLSCVQQQTDAIPRTAMARFNDDGTLRSILKKTSVTRSNIVDSKAEKEEDGKDEEYGLQETSNDQCHKSVDETDDTVPPPLPTSPPPALPSPARPDLPATPPYLIPSEMQSPQSTLLPFSPPTSVPSSILPSLPSQTRTPSPHLPPPLPSSHPSLLPFSSPPPMPPSPAQWVSSFISSPRPSSSPTPVDQSPSPLPPPHASFPSPQIPRRPIASDVSSATSSISSLSSAWGRDSGPSKFLGLQNLRKHTAILKKRSRSDLGATSSILDAIHQK